MRHQRIRNRAMLVTLFMTASAWAGPGSAEAPAALTGTFLQLSERYRDFRAGDWEALFGDFSKLGLDHVIVQWSVADGVAFYPSERFESLDHPPLETLLHLADQAGMGVLVGLGHDSAFWRRIERDPQLVEVYLNRLRLTSLAAARELAPRMERHASFRGWYLPEEIDDVHWLDRERRALLVDHLRRSAEALHELTPRGRVAVSGFTNAHVDPTTLRELWYELLTETSIDRVLFQDGIGVKKLALDELPLYLDAVRGAVDDAGRELAVVVEVFEQTAGEPLDAEPFRAVPAPPERVRRQLEIAALYSTGGPVAFAVPEYMTSLGGVSAEELMSSLVSDER